MPELDDEMDEIIESFIIETDEILEKLGRDLLELDHGEVDPELANSIFRSVHTIKGTSSFLGFENIRKLAHKSEDLFNRVRKGEMHVTPAKMDVVFAAYDLLKTLLQQVKTEMHDDYDLTDILKKLELATQDDGKELSEAGDRKNSSEKNELQVPEKDPAKENVLAEETMRQEAPDLSGKENKKKKVGGVIKNEINTTIRVDVARLDNLLDLVGELVLSRNRLQQIISQSKDRENDSSQIQDLYDSSTQIHTITNEIQMAVMKTRMVSVAKVFNKIPRLIRDLCKESGKKVEVQIFGEETELDKTIIEELNDPLVHLIRNAVDHGIGSTEERTAAGKEPKGTVRVKAEHEGNHIVISIEDDGKGIDPEKIKQKALANKLIFESQAREMPKRDIYNLIFTPGFSTAAKITNISGRGVGMDVVKTNLSKLKGLIEIESEPGKGTKFILKLPLTLAIIQGLLIKVGFDIFSIPLDSVVEVVRIKPDDIETINGKEVVLLRDSVLSLIRLSDIFSGIEYKVRSTWLHVVVVGVAEKRVGLIVDSLLGQKEIVIKSLGNYLGDVPGIAGSTILGDGRVVMILDLKELISRSGGAAAVQKKEMMAAV